MLEDLVWIIYRSWLLPRLAEAKRSLKEWWRECRTGGWPAIEGSVHQARYWQDRDSWNVELSYYYKIAGEFYSGYSAYQFAAEGQVDEFLRRFPAGAPLIVRYHERKPEASLLTLKDQAAALAAS